MDGEWDLERHCIRMQGVLPSGVMLPPSMLLDVTEAISSSSGTASNR